MGPRSLGCCMISTLILSDRQSGHIRGVLHYLPVGRRKSKARAKKIGALFRTTPISLSIIAHDVSRVEITSIIARDFSMRLLRLYMYMPCSSVGCSANLSYIVSDRIMRNRSKKKQKHWRFAVVGSMPPRRPLFVVIIAVWK